MQDARDEVSVGTGYAAAALHEELHGPEASAGHQLVVGALDAAADRLEVHRPLVGAVWDADAAADVDELEFDAEFRVELSGKLEEHPRGVDDVVRVELVRGDHCVDAEAPDSGVAHRGVALEELVAGEAVLRLLRLADDGVAALERTGVVAAAEEARGERVGALRERTLRQPSYLSQRVEEKRPV